MAQQIKTGPPPLSRRQSLWLLVAALTTAAPLAAYVPVWLASTAAMALAWRGWLLWRQQPLPPRWLLTLLALTGVAAVGVQFHTIFGKDPGIALLAVFLTLKLLEMRTARDALAVLLLAYFLVLSHFFYSQTMIAAAIMVGNVLLITAALTNISHERRSPLATLRLSALLLAQATPFMLLLFVLFPRVSGPLWGLPADAYSALSGLSDSMAPGSISQLSLSDAIAFRAKFVQSTPTQASLYWRGPVLSSFDGRVWRGSPSSGERAAASSPSARLPYPAGADSDKRNIDIDYEVTLEPHNKTWLFGLELPTMLPPDSRMSADYQIFSRTPVHNRLRYEMRSRLDLTGGADESPARLRESLQLPLRLNSRSRELALQLRREASSDTAVVEGMMRYYRGQPFIYTLQPPLLGENDIDEFLFDTRRGFCEHFAASLVFVMRAAGIPARVVTGYQGGEINPVDGYLVVRQSDAHAWAEVWLAGRGWQRVDPTAAAAPLRIESNLAAAMPAGEPLPFMTRPEFSWLRDLRYRLDAIGNGWNQWVLGYNPQRQRDFLQNLGMKAPDWQRMTTVLTMSSGLLMLLLTGWVLIQRQGVDPLQKEWARFSRKLQRRGLQRLPWEGPRDYAKRVAARWPEQRDDVHTIAAIYAALRYGAPVTDDTLPELRRRITTFSP
jgi:transglutaminase-like putative cysteine protease